MEALNILNNLNLLKSNNFSNINILENDKEYINITEVPTKRINESNSSYQALHSIINDLGNLENLRKLNEIKNFIVSNKDTSNMKTSSLLKDNSIIIPSSSTSIQSVDQDIINTSVNYLNNEKTERPLIDTTNANQNKKINISSISIPSDINLYKQESSFDLRNMKNRAILNILKNNQIDCSNIDCGSRNSSQHSINNINSINIPSSDSIFPSNSFSFENMMNTLSRSNTLSPLSLTQSPPFSMNISNTIPLSQEPISMNNPCSLPLDQNHLCLTSPFNQNIKNVISIDNSINKQSLNQLQLLNLIKLLNNQKMSGVEKSIKSITDGLTIPASLSNNKIQNGSNNFYLNSIVDNSNLDNNISSLNSQLQLQQQMHSPVLNINNKERMDFEYEEKKSKNSFENIPSILIDESSDIINSSISRMTSMSDKEKLGSDSIDSFLKLSLPNKPNEINNNTPLSPALSPVLTSSKFIDSTLENTLKNCIKKNENNAFNSMETLNDIISFFPETDSMSVTRPIENYSANSISDKCTRNEGELPVDNIVDDLMDSFKNQVKDEFIDNDKSFLRVDDTFLNVPATPKSISNISNSSNCDLTEFPNFIESFDDNSIINNINNNDDDMSMDITSFGENDYLSINNPVITLPNEFNGENDHLSIDNPVITLSNEFNGENDHLSIDNPVVTLSNEFNDTVKLNISPKENGKSIDNEEKIVENNEKSKILKKSRGRPRKKKNNDSPREKFIKMSKSIDKLLSSELYTKLYSEERNDSIIHNKHLHPKKVCFDQDFKFVKQVNTLNYIIVSYKRMCTALCQNNDINIQAISEATENQYDIPMEDAEDEWEINNNENILESDSLIKNDKGKPCTCQEKVEERKHKEYEECENENCEEYENCEKCEEKLKTKDCDRMKNDCDCLSNVNDDIKIEVKISTNDCSNIDVVNTEEEEQEEKKEKEKVVENDNEKNIDYNNLDEEEVPLSQRKEIQRNNILTSSISRRKSKTTNQCRNSLIYEKADLDLEVQNDKEECKEGILIQKVEINNNRKRKLKTNDTGDTSLNKAEVYVNTLESNNKKKKVIRLSITQIKSSIENGNRLSIGNSLGTNSVSALTKSGLVLVGRKRVIAENTNRPYVCTSCGAGFVRKHDLNRHEKVHTGIKNYKCPYCERAFSRNDALTRHLRIELKHKSKNKDNKNEKRGCKKIKEIEIL